ncbi:MAG TPA: hypothetical protein VHI13_21975 [Candidatus Kapabacteria bacterium]|nr:hypothetical protein [Candidatus Kapabacteria bacterium]
MSKPPAHDLFTLIKSLTKTEKRLFKLYAARHAIGGKNKYVQLFDAIDRQKQYDERALLAQNPSLRPLDLRSMKPYLYDLILRCLRDSLRDRSAASRMRYQVEKCELLIHKGLYAQASRQLARVEHIAEAEGSLLLLLTILDHEQSLKVRAAETNTLERQEELYGRQIATLDMLRQNIEYYHLFMRTYYLHVNATRPLSGADRDRVDDVRSSPLLHDDAAPLTPYGWMTLYEIHTRLCEISGDRIGALRYSRKKVAFMDSVPGYREGHLYEYVYAVTSLVTFSLLFYLYEEAERQLATLKSLEISSPRLRVELGICRYHCELSYLRHSGQFERAMQLVPEIAGFIDGHRDEIEITTILDFHVVFLDLAIKHGDPASARHWLGELVSNRDLYRFSRFLDNVKLLTVIVYFEANDFDALESAVRSVYRYLRKKERLFDFENILLHFLRKLPGIADAAALQEELRRLHAELEAVSETPEGVRRNFQFDYMTWLESRIRNLRFADVLQENIGRWRREKHEILRNAGVEIVQRSMPQRTAR